MALSTILAVRYFGNEVLQLCAVDIFIQLTCALAA